MAGLAAAAAVAAAAAPAAAKMAVLPVCQWAKEAAEHPPPAPKHLRHNLGRQVAEAGWHLFLLVFLIRPSSSSRMRCRTWQPATARCSSCRALSALASPQLHAALAVAPQQGIALGIWQVPLGCLHQRRQGCTAAKAPAGAPGHGCGLGSARASVRFKRVCGCSALPPARITLPATLTCHNSLSPGGHPPASGPALLCCSGQ
jgi:hypothetical protein